MPAHFDYGIVGVTYHSRHAEDRISIECFTARMERSIDPEYPVLNFGNMTIFPTTEQLRELHQVIGVWLDIESERLAGVAEVNPMEPATAEPAARESIKV